MRATQITEEMKIAAARAIADIVADDELREDYIIPSVFNREVAPAVAAAVAAEARESGTAEAGAELGFASTEEFGAIPGGNTRRRTSPATRVDMPCRTQQTPPQRAAGST